MLEFCRTLRYNTNDNLIMRDVNFVVTPFTERRKENMQMKRILALLLAAAVMVGTLCACGGTTSGSNSAAQRRN